MSYESALEAAGAKIIAFDSFGSYQGDWWAKVEYQGNIGWIHGYYGSCSGCDAFAAEFGWAERETDEEYAKHLCEFGEGYLTDLYTQEEAEANAAKDVSWDVDAEEMLNFIKANA